MSATPFSLSYYRTLITSEYRPAPNFIAWLGAVVQMAIDVFNCSNQFASAFDIDQAAGPQLDILGVIIGQSRTVGFQPSNGVSPILDDTTYRLLLRARVFQNHWGGTTQELRGIWNQLFPGGNLLVTDNQNMTVNFYVAGSGFTSIVQDLILNGYIIPRPQGVLYTIALAELPIFGFDQNTPEIAGFDLGHFAG